MNNLTEISLTADVTTRRIPALKCIQPVVSAFKDKIQVVRNVLLRPGHHSKDTVQNST